MELIGFFNRVKKDILDKEKLLSDNNDCVALFSTMCYVAFCACLDANDFDQDNNRTSIDLGATHESYFLMSGLYWT